MSNKIQNSLQKLRIFALAHNTYVAWIVLIVGLLLTLLAWSLTDNSQKATENQRFENRVNEITRSVFSRMQAYEQLLWSSVGFMNAAGQVDRARFRNFVDNLKIQDHWAGIQGIGYSILVSPEQRAGHIEALRAEGFPEYTIKPEGERDQYSSIIYLEPFDWRNQRAFGYDMWSNPSRRQAMARAVDTGDASLSGIITLVQETETDVQKGFLMYLPRYQSGKPIDTQAQRREAFLGWVYSPFRMGDLMIGTLGTEQSNVAYQIFDGESTTQESLLFDSNHLLPNTLAQPYNGPRKSVELNLQGRKWLIILTVKNSLLTTAEEFLPTFIAIVGLIINILVFYLIASLALLKQRAEKLADEKTLQVREANEKLQLSVRELKASNEELSKFAYVASHDLQEPLRMVTSFCGLLKTDYADKLDKDGIEYINFAVDGSNRMKSLIDSLLLYARVSKNAPVRESVDCEIILKETLIDLQNAITDSQAKITYDQLPKVGGERDAIRQLFQNLLLNSIKFKSESAPVIHISATQTGKEWQFRVSDNGIGISADHSEQIFIIFRRLHSREKYPGSGMGLAVCKKIIDRHGGRIWVEPGEITGSIFSFTLPIWKEKEQRQ